MEGEDHEEEDYEEQMDYMVRRKFTIGIGKPRG